MMSGECYVTDVTSYVFSGHIRCGLVCRTDLRHDGRTKTLVRKDLRTPSYLMTAIVTDDMLLGPYAMNVNILLFRDYSLILERRSSERMACSPVLRDMLQAEL